MRAPTDEWLTNLEQEAGHIERAFDARLLVCRLQALVSTDVVGFDYAADCFCNDRKAEDGYRNDGRSIAYIVRAVRAAIEAGVE